MRIQSCVSTQLNVDWSEMYLLCVNLISPVDPRWRGFQRFAVEVNVLITLSHTVPGCWKVRHLKQLICYQYWYFLWANIKTSKCKVELEREQELIGTDGIRTGSWVAIVRAAGYEGTPAALTDERGMVFHIGHPSSKCWTRLALRFTSPQLFSRCK